MSNQTPDSVERLLWEFSAKVDMDEFASGERSVDPELVSEYAEIIRVRLRTEAAPPKFVRPFVYIVTTEGGGS